VWALANAGRVAAVWVGKPPNLEAVGTASDGRKCTQESHTPAPTVVPRVTASQPFARGIDLVGCDEPRDRRATGHVGWRRFRPGPAVIDALSSPSDMGWLNFEPALAQF